MLCKALSSSVDLPVLNSSGLPAVGAAPLGALPFAPLTPWPTFFTSLPADEPNAPGDLAWSSALCSFKHDYKHITYSHEYTGREISGYVLRPF